jgi:hypothetical protein
VVASIDNAYPSQLSQWGRDLAPLSLWERGRR